MSWKLFDLICGAIWDWITISLLCISYTLFSSIVVAAMGKVWLDKETWAAFWLIVLVIASTMIFGVIMDKHVNAEERLLNARIKAIKRR